ncbi:hypothetical protein JXM83_01920 [Candidatus Woesearchaeota archaeon]|nr:hypothetical protein [Candidatus Woesearchaeota archaeon]
MKILDDYFGSSVAKNLVLVPKVEGIFEIHFNDSILGYYKNTFENHTPYISSRRFDAEELFEFYSVLKCEGIYHPDSMFMVSEFGKKFGVEVVMPVLEIHNVIRIKGYSFLQDVVEKRNQIDDIIGTFFLGTRESHPDVDFDWNWGMSKNEFFYHDLHIINMTKYLMD